ncbi:MAG TPA: glutathionylspermidine synthase family protein [Chloroflexota bacterium]|nr:glutathionylspermidine synthase family protein [Chloroflexota bacterium]
MLPRDRTAARSAPPALAPGELRTLAVAEWRADPAGYQARWTAYLHEAALRYYLYDSTVAGDPYLGFDALVLDRAAWQRLVEATELLGQVFQRAVRAVQRDRPTLERLGFPWPVAEMLVHEPAAPWLSPIGRFDFLLDSHGEWRLLEYNCDTPSGVRETSGAERLLARLLDPRGAYRRLGSRLAARLRAAFARLLQTAPRPVRRLGLVTDAGYAEDLAQLLFLREVLRDLGPELVLGDIDNLVVRRGRVYLLGRPVEALYRLYPIERLYGQPVFPGLLDAALAGRVLLLNPIAALLAQDKALLAWIWAHRQSGLFTPAQQRAIARHLPETYLITEVPAELDRRAFVVKEFFGREGEEVYLGEALDAADWERCRAWRTFVVQRLVESQQVETVFWRGARLEPVRCIPCVGSYLAAGRWAGVYVRLGDRITTNRAQHVAAFVAREPAP